MVEDTEGTVYGEAMTFPDIDETLARLDVLEGYRPDSPGRSLFLRRRGLLPEGAVHIPSGRCVTAAATIGGRHRLASASMARHQ